MVSFHSPLHKVNIGKMIRHMLRIGPAVRTFHSSTAENTVDSKRSLIAAQMDVAAIRLDTQDLVMHRVNKRGFVFWLSSSSITPIKNTSYFSGIVKHCQTSS